MEGASNGEVCHRVGVLLVVRHGCAREVDDREVDNEAVWRLPERGLDSGVDGGQLRAALLRRLRIGLHGVQASSRKRAASPT